MKASDWSIIIMEDCDWSPVAPGEDVPHDPAILGHGLHGAGPHCLGDRGQRDEALPRPPANIILHLPLVNRIKVTDWSTVRMEASDWQIVRMEAYNKATLNKEASD